MNYFGNLSKYFRRPYNGKFGGGGGGAYKTFTIVRDEVSDPTKFFLRYEDDATDMTKGSTDFDIFFGYSAVLLDPTGNEVEEVVQSSPGVLDMSSFQGALTGTANNVMIKFPRRGIKMSKSGSEVSLSITDDPNKEGFQYYAFTKGTADKNFLYLGAYEGSFSDDNATVSGYTAGTTYLKSWATKTRTANCSPASGNALTNYRSSALKYNNGYSLLTIYPRRYVSALYMMKYGNPDSQTVIGKGYTGGGSQTTAPGNTNSRTNATYGNTNSSTDQIKLFGLEDRRGNVNDALDCCFVDGSKNLTVDQTNSIFQDSAYATNLGVKSGGYISKIYGTTDAMFNVIQASGGATSYYADYSQSTASRSARVGGSYSEYGDGGIFCMRTGYPGNGITDQGARLQFL